jgi:pyridoxal 5'-phosphate synthase pdxS subunit
MEQFLRTWTSDLGLVQKLRGGVIVEAGTPQQARIAEEAGASAVVLRQKPTQAGNLIREVARMPSPELLSAVKEATTIPVIAGCRAGHFTEAQILQCLGVDGLNEFGDLSQENGSPHIWKHDFETPFLCEVSTLADAIARIDEGAAMLCIRGEVGTGNVAATIKQIRDLFQKVNDLRDTPAAELMTDMQGTGFFLELIEAIKQRRNLPIPIFAFGGISTPADAALMMKLGMHGVLVEEEIFQDTQPDKRLAAIVRAARFPDCIDFIAELSRSL